MYLLGKFLFVSTGYSTSPFFTVFIGVVNYFLIDFLKSSLYIKELILCYVDSNISFSVYHLASIYKGVYVFCNTKFLVCF